MACLPSRISAAYYYFFDIDLKNKKNHNMINTGVHLPYLIIQSFFYFFCLTLLYLTVKKKFNKKICFFIFLFLSLEPTIFQYHGTFWSESYFFSFQFLLIALILKPKLKIRTFFLIGILLAILSMQKEVAMFYIIPVIIYFSFFLKQYKIKNFLSLIIGFIIIQSFVGFNNYIRSGTFYIMPSTTKTDLHQLVVTPVMSKKLNITTTEFETLEGKVALNWINKNSITLSEVKFRDQDKGDKNQNIIKFSSIKDPGFMIYRFYIIDESDRIKFDEFIQKRTFKYIVDYPIDFLNLTIKNSIHILLLNPFHIYSDHNYISSEIYYLSTEHDKFILYRIFYTLAIFLICLVGLIQLIRKKEYKLLTYLILSILYFYIGISWSGNTRYFLPSFIYFSFFFAVGMDKLIYYKKVNSSR